MSEMATLAELSMPRKLRFRWKWFFRITPVVVFDGEKMNDAGWLVPVAVVSGIAGILGLILVVSSRLDKRRRQQWLEVATALGFEYLTV